MVIFINNKSPNVDCYGRNMHLSLIRINFDTMRTAADPISRLPHVYETQARDEHAARDARRDVADTLRYVLT